MPPNRLPDEELLRRFRRGEDAAFERLVERHARGARRFASHLLGDTAEAEDVAQEGFLRVLLAAREGRFDPTRGRFAPFFFRILRNLSVDRLRARRIVSHQAVASVAPPRSDPGMAAEHREQRDRVHALVQALPPNERAAILLREFEGLTYREIADVLGASLDQVKTWIFRARRRIERQWTRPSPSIQRSRRSGTT